MRKNKVKSLFSKLLLMNFLVIFISSVVISFVTYLGVSSYVKKEHEKTILTAAKEASDITTWFNNMNKDLDRLSQSNPFRQDDIYRLLNQLYDNYNSTLVTISVSTKMSILRISPDNEIIFRYADINDFNKNFHADITHIPENEYINEILNAKESELGVKRPYQDNNYYLYWGNLGGLFRETTLTVGCPIYHDGTLDSALILFVSIPQVNSMMNVILSNFLIAAAVSVVICVIISYVLSYRIAKPLRAMNEVSEKIASGKFSSRVNITDRNKVSEISELVDTFNNMASALEHFENNRRTFIASVSHELRTPMTSIIGFVDGILDGTIPESDHEKYLNIILSETKRLSRLVTELMEISRLDAGKVSLNMTCVDINECIRKQLIKFEDRIVEKNLNVEASFLNEKCECLCDEDSITRVIINLLDNAIKFSNQDGYIKINTTVLNHKAQISIENDGDGINSEDISHIFEKFYKTDKSRSIDKKGIGMGLFIAQNIISAHDEKIFVKSVPGEYTKFTFTLKLYK